MCLQTSWSRHKTYVNARVNVGQVPVPGHRVNRITVWIANPSRCSLSKYLAFAWPRRQRIYSLQLGQLLYILYARRLLPTTRLCASHYTDLFSNGCIYETRLASPKLSLSEYSPSLDESFFRTRAPNSASSFYTSLPNSAVRGPLKPHISIMVLCRVTRPGTAMYMCPY